MDANTKHNIESLTLTIALNFSPDKIDTVQDAKDIRNVWEVIATLAQEHIGMWDKHIAEKEQPQVFDFDQQDLDELRNLINSEKESK